MKTKTPIFWRSLAATAVALSVATPQFARAAVSEAEEIKAGQQVARQAEKEFGPALSANDPMQRRARQIGAQFARLSQRRNIPYSYTVLRNDKVLNAFAAPGGPIFVTTKLMQTVSNDAELAYVLGHETAHIDRRHIVKQVEKQQKLGVGAAILGAIFGRRVGAIGNIYGSLQSLKYSRADENESDTVGVRMMAQLGYDPRAAVTMLGKLGGGGGVEILASHPDPKARQTSVQNLINREKLIDISRRMGGPRLNMDGNSSSVYDDDRNPSSNGDDPGYDNGYDDNSSNRDEIDLGAPLRLRASTRENANVIMAPVAGLARWAGASVSVDGTETTLRRGGRTIVLYRNSGVIEVDGRSSSMSTTAVAYNGVLYAPLGAVARALGANATLEGNIVRLSLPGRTSGYVQVP